MRIAPEWKDYDNEIKDLIHKWQSKSSNHTGTYIQTASSTKRKHLNFL